LSSIPVLPDYSTYNILHKGSVAFIWWLDNTRNPALLGPLA
jgi:hypothetical protein